MAVDARRFGRAASDAGRYFDGKCLAGAAGRAFGVYHVLYFGVGERPTDRQVFARNPGFSVVGNGFAIWAKGANAIASDEQRYGWLILCGQIGKASGREGV